MNIRCKFQLQEIRLHAGCGDAKTYIFRPQYDISIPEDQRFCQYSPTGEFSIYVTNPIVHDEWKLGDFYYFDATPVPAEAPADAT